MSVTLQNLAMFKRVCKAVNITGLKSMLMTRVMQMKHTSSKLNESL
jgi:hypothetical protein